MLLALLNVVSKDNMHKSEGSSRNRLWNQIFLVVWFYCGFKNPNFVSGSKMIHQRYSMETFRYWSSSSQSKAAVCECEDLTGKKDYFDSKVEPQHRWLGLVKHSLRCQGIKVIVQSGMSWIAILFYVMSLLWW